MLHLDELESPTLASAALPRTRGADPVPESVQSLDRRGYVALGSGELAAAEQHFRRALQRRQRASGAERQGLPQAFGRLGLVAVHRGDLEAAQSLFELGVELARALRPRLLVDDAMLLQNLGLARRCGRLDEAERLHAEALAIKVASLGWSHPCVATTLTSQGYLALLRRRCAEALDCFERARMILERADGELSPDLAHVLMGAGRAHLHLAQAAAAERAFAAALQIRERLLAPVAQRSRSRFALACARWPRAPASARALAERALRDYATSRRPDPRLLQRMRAWLEQRPSLYFAAA